MDLRNPPHPKGCVRPVTDDDWEPFKDTIIRLYVDENNTLPALMATMRCDHGFNATRKQYTRRFEIWNLYKNISSENMRNMSRIQQRRRDVENKETAFEFQGRPVPQEKIGKWRKRSEMAEGESCQSEMSAPTPSNIEYYTPGASVSTPSIDQVASASDRVVNDENSRAFDNSDQFSFVPQSPSGSASFGGRLPNAIQCSNCTGRRKALFVGINYFGQRGELSKCINDVRNMAAFLIEHFRYKRDDMIILTDDQHDAQSLPSKQNILQAMHWLVKDAEVNDTLFFHYSGHHGPSTNLEGTRDINRDEVIYPVDFHKNGHIADDEMHRIMVQPLKPGVRLTAVIDSTHSCATLDLPYFYTTQGLLKEPNLAKEAGHGLLGVISSYRQNDLEGVALNIIAIFEKATSGGDAHDKFSPSRPSMTDVIVLSSSFGYQAPFRDDRVQSIAIPAAFFKAIKENPQQTYVQLLNSIRDEIATTITTSLR
ncbi:Ca(2+)-dependent cysteine protease [Conoideocrella luteorostrata]|uniref:Ca(2+)-dependent cysteine protease n=1 Tax=Conoideocrella luteorostrata TaxID=1105319 RepID=A0AAJ0CV74_9HYPO|nr:Ca(2+)-dependent cysteine protease [Conoideocrella luteorostrata]